MLEFDFNLQFDAGADSLFCQSSVGEVEVILKSNPLPTSPTSQAIQRRTIQRPEDIAAHLTSSFLVFMLRFVSNSRSGLTCSRSLFNHILSQDCASPRLKDFMTCFRRKHHRNDYAHPPYFLRQVEAGLNTQIGDLERIYGFRYPAIRDYKQTCNDISNWSVRPLLVSEKYQALTNQTRWIFVGVMRDCSFEKLLVEYMRKKADGNYSYWALHASILAHCIARWKLYLATLSENAKERSLEFRFVEAEDLYSFETRRKLNNLEDSLLNLPLMLRSIRGTLKCLAENYRQRTEEPLPVSFEELLEETKLLLQRVEILEKQVKSISLITRDLSVHHNSLAMMEIAKSTKNDSAAMKIITIITVLFLPATFVATFFSTQFVDISDNEFHLSRRTWIYFAVTVPLTFLTIAVWLVGMKAEKISRWMPKSFNKRSHERDESRDIELGKEYPKGNNKPPEAML